ncbi:ThuA domain-containing protein [Lentisphaera profundi]|uniref:ThuA domain-containing protein n=1 Tax=Lentisphaera profundi TaxID=1658616 RepID=A0ABY7VXM5_9BACT|nr:ThuA domain-containing protein [Lentisphaera profundi]WDE99006.1 ThuA domain-containing protein [Lentisphaera profundi]
MYKKLSTFLALAAITFVNEANAAKVSAAEELANIKEAMPGAVNVKKKYKVLCFSKPYGFPHSSIHTAKKMIQVMGDKTGMFTVDFSDDAKDLSAANLAKYDALYLNNTTKMEKGIKDPLKRKELIDFVKNGGGLFAVHAATDGGWPEYVEMTGGDFDGHPWGHEGTYCLCNEDPTHPIVANIFDGEQSFNINDELYQYKNFDRENNRVLVSIDMSKFQNHRGGMKREDNDYAMVWIKEFGKGRVFVSSPGHNHHIYWNKDMLKMWVEGMRFVLGELEVNTASKSKPAYALPSKSGKQDPLVKQRSEKESMKEFEVQGDYSLELVAGDDMLYEPTLCVWDGNGRMYVAQFETYMQDVDGTGKYDEVSRVLRLEDTNDDGVMDKRTVFADKLNLPRLVLPLKDSVLIGETNTNDIYEYFDTDNDGVSDKKKIWYEGGKRGGNLEHQPSGLLWSMDNNIYTTYNQHAYRFTDGTVTKVETKGNRGQWGLTQDNYGKVIFADAGAGVGPVHTLFPNIYTKWDPKWVREDGFSTVWGIDKVYDAQGGMGSMRDNGTIRRFTDTCGQAVFRGDKLPKEMQGELFFSSPVGRLTRRTTFKVDDKGRQVMHNAYDEKEFIASTDANFRPVNAATGPDGTLYLVDMHRGIIQEGAWVPKGSFIRKAVEFYGLDKNIGHGRIYRVRHKDFQPNDKKPRMLDETPAELVRHLSHANGWWRDEAQKLIVLSGDKSVESALKKVISSGKSDLGRLHALWTLEGLGLIDIDYLKVIYKDKNPHMRAAAIRMTEPYFHKDIKNIYVLKSLIKDPAKEVAIQLMLSASTTVTKETRSLAKAVMNANPENDYLAEIDAELNKAYFEEQQRLAALAKLNAEEAALMAAGKQHFDALCATCHGPDGKGMPAGHGLMAPSFVNNTRVLGDKGVVTRITLHGFTGPIEGKTYAGGMMMPLKTNDDKYLASVLTYIRNSFGNKAEMISEQDVAQVRKESKGVKVPFTEQTLKDLLLNAGGDIKLWKLTASHKPELLINMQDGDEKTTFATKAAMKKGMWIEAEFPHQRNIFKVNLKAKGGDFAKSVKIEVSKDGKIWKTVMDQVKGKTFTSVSFPMVVAKKVRITCLEDKGAWWQLYDLEIVGPGMGDIDQYPKNTRHYLLFKDAKSAKIGWGNFKQDKNISIGKVKYKKGIWTHAHSEMVFDLAGKNYKRFYSKVGHSDSGRDTFLTFEVYLDGERAFDSGDMFKGEAAKFVDVDLSGVKQLKLVVTQGKDVKPDGDHACWADALFVKEAPKKAKKAQKKAKEASTTINI